MVVSIHATILQMSDVYRDPLAGLRSQVQLLKAEVHTLEQTFTEDLWRHMPAPLREIIKARKGEWAAAKETHEALYKAIASLESTLAALKEAKALAPELERYLNTPPSTPPEVFRSFADLHLGCESTAFLPLWNILSELDPDLTVDLEDPRTGCFYAHFKHQQAPFALLCFPGVELVGDRKNTYLATTVPRVFPPLRLYAEGPWHSLVKTLGLLKETEVGHENFDGLFHIEGKPDDVQALLTEEVREGLLTLARFDIPTLKMEQGQVTLSWAFTPNRKMLRGAVQTLHALRTAPIQVRLLKEHPRPE